MPKHLPFNSQYLQNFQVVEQREGNISRFPHTGQLPKLLRALNLEFRAGLPDRIARVDHRAKDYMKIQLEYGAGMFCFHFNKARRDGLSLFVLTDPNRISRISIVQQITEHKQIGGLHRFKFYGGDDFFTEMHLNGRRIGFADHVLDRFSERLPNPIGADLTCFLLSFFGGPVVLMHCNERPAFVCDYQNSIVAFPIRQSDTEYFLPTCLGPDEISRLEPILPPPAYNFYYDPAYKDPKLRNWNTVDYMYEMKNKWDLRTPLSFPQLGTKKKFSWLQLGQTIAEACERSGFKEGSRMVLRDNIPGNCSINLLPGKEEELYDVLEDLKIRRPGGDWEQIAATQKASHPEW